MTLDEFISHSRERDYMSDFDRDELRVKQTAEIFTPTALVQEILDKIPADQFSNPDSNSLDPTCGDGQFLSEVMIKKMENGLTYIQARDSTYGAELMEDNCVECIRRLFGDGGIRRIGVDHPNFPDNYEIVKGLIAIFYWNGELVKTIVQADALEYNFDFNQPD